MSTSVYSALLTYIKTQAPLSAVHNYSTSAWGYEGWEVVDGNINAAVLSALLSFGRADKVCDLFIETHNDTVFSYQATIIRHEGLEPLKVVGEATLKHKVSTSRSIRMRPTRKWNLITYMSVEWSHDNREESKMHADCDNRGGACLACRAL